MDIVPRDEAGYWWTQAESVSATIMNILTKCTGLVMVPPIQHLISAQLSINAAMVSNDTLRLASVVQEAEATVKQAVPVIESAFRTAGHTLFNDC